MKKLVYIIAILAAFAACNNSKNNTDTDETETEDPIFGNDEYEENGIVKFKVQPDTLRDDNGNVIATVSVTPDPSQPTAQNANLGKTYCDNKATIKFKDITKTFTKADFASYLTPEMNKNSILETITIQEYTNGSLHLFANICTPHTEEEASIIVTIASNGSVTMKPWEETDADIIDEGLYDEDGEGE